MRMKINDLDNGALVWAMQQVLEHYRNKISLLEALNRRHFGDEGWQHQKQLILQDRCEIKWFIAGPIIEREGISLEWQPQYRSEPWHAVDTRSGISSSGIDPLLAAMRCFITKLDPDLNTDITLNAAIAFCENQCSDLSQTVLSDEHYREKCRKRLLWTFAGEILEGHGVSLEHCRTEDGSSYWRSNHPQWQGQHDFTSTDPSSLVIKTFIAIHQSTIEVPDEILQKDADAIAEGRLIDMEHVSVKRQKIKE